MSRITIDALSHQAIRAQGTETTAYGNAPEAAGRWRGERLEGLEAMLRREGHSFRFGLPLASELGDADILIIASRSQSCPFSKTELADIGVFVRGGGGLLLMANHRNFIAPQQRVATALDLPIAFNDVTIVNFPPFTMADHPVGRGVTGLRVRNTCSLRVAPPAETIAVFAPDPRHIFAAACSAGSGRVVVTGDSGFIASKDDTGLDLFASAGNARFVANALAWLGRR